MFTEKEKIELMSDVKVIKSNVADMKPQVKSNTRLRFMVYGFSVISIPLVYLTMAIMRMIK